MIMILMHETESERDRDGTPYILCLTFLRWKDTQTDRERTEAFVCISKCSLVKRAIQYIHTQSRVCMCMLCHTERERVLICVSRLNAHLVKPQTQKHTHTHTHTKELFIIWSIIHHKSPLYFQASPQSPHIGKLYDPEMIDIISFTTIQVLHAIGISDEENPHMVFSEWRSV